VRSSREVADNAQKAHSRFEGGGITKGGRYEQKGVPLPSFHSARRGRWDGHGRPPGRGGHGVGFHSQAAKILAGNCFSAIESYRGTPILAIGRTGKGAQPAPRWERLSRRAPKREKNGPGGTTFLNRDPWRRILRGDGQIQKTGQGAESRHELFPPSGVMPKQAHSWDG